MKNLNQILSLARSGSPAQAWTQFIDAGWDDITDNPKALTLKGRLLKDRAKAEQVAGNSEYIQLYARSADAYSAAAAIKSDSYPLINAATMALLSGKPVRASQIAKKVIAFIDENPDEGENAYWRAATRAEALLLMGEETQARAALSDAIERLPDAWEDHAATLSQFGTILSEQGRSIEWLDRHRPPSSIYYSGIIKLMNDDISDSIDEYIAHEKPAFAYGSLAAGSDILCAKAFLKYKKKHKPHAQLHIILPFPIDQFCELSVVPFGENWIVDFEDILAEASSVHIMGLDDPPHDIAVEMADTVAIGQALRNAQILQSHAKALTIIGRGENLRPQLNQWQQLHGDVTILETDRGPNGVGKFSQHKHNAQRRALLWVEGEYRTLFASKIWQENIWLPKNTGHYIVLDTMKSAYDMVKNITRDHAVQITILYDIMDEPSMENLQRAQSMAKTTPLGVTTCDYNSAMALTFGNIADLIEEIGELKTIWGSQSLWTVA